MEPSARALLDAVAAITADLRLPDVQRRVVASACALADAEQGVLAVLGTDQQFSEVVQVGGSAEYHGVGDLPTGPGVLAVPIRVRGKMFGHLRLTGKRDGEAFSDHDEEWVGELAAAAGVAIDNATRYEQALQRERWREASQQVTAALLTGDDGNATLHTIADRARQVANASAAGVALPGELDPSTLVFEVIASPDPDHHRLIGATVPAEGTATGVAFTSGEPVVVRQYGGHVVTQQEGTATSVPPAVKDLDSAVAVPLVVGSETLGVLVVTKFQDEVPFTELEVELVRDFAGHAALAVEFARAEDDRRRLAVYEDRDRIARDLHDLVIQRLFAIGLGLEGLTRLTTQPELADRVTGFVQDLDRTIRDVRNSIFSLREPAEVHGGVRSDLLRLAQDSVGLLGFEPRISFDGPLDTAVTGPVRSDLITTVREALSNVAEHAEASSVSIEVLVGRNGRRLTLTVVDDGIGTAGESGRTRGLATLRRLAARWNGTLSVLPRAAGGTKLEWTAVLDHSPGGDG
jgi:signal transduction histidine kinase